MPFQFQKMWRGYCYQRFMLARTKYCHCPAYVTRLIGPVFSSWKKIEVNDPLALLRVASFVSNLKFVKLTPAVRDWCLPFPIRSFALTRYVRSLWCLGLGRNTNRSLIGRQKSLCCGRLERACWQTGGSAKIRWQTLYCYRNIARGPPNFACSTCRWILM